MTPEEVKQRMLDDLICFGETASKTTIEDGAPVMRYIDPISPEMQAIIYNAEHTDSAMQIHYLPITEKSYDGSRLNFAIGYDPFDITSILKSKNSLYDRMIGIIHFRLPRKLKKKVKLYIGIRDHISKRNLYFQHQVYSVAKYYSCKILVEKI